jgi:arabinofuranosyltransferase
LEPDSAPPSALRIAFATLLCAAVCAMVWRFAWVSEDAFITFRYVANTVAGHGAVFNLGEPVQGYTHPLWFLVLVVGHVFIPDLYWLAIAMGMALTAITQLYLAFRLLQMGGHTIHGGLLAGVASVLLVSSGSWLSFQTGGLENALSHLLIVMLVIELVTKGIKRPFSVSLLGALLVTNRPDLALLLVPLSLLLLPRLRDRRALAAIAMGALPLMMWVAFALVYYGDIIPNTARAKVGIFATPAVAMGQGATYLKDWLIHEPLPALSTLVLLTLASFKARTAASRALVAGIWLQLGYVVWVGGDFMRGRFLLAIFVASVTMGLSLLVREAKVRGVPARWSAMALALVVLLALVSRSLVPAPPLAVPASGIFDERSFYPGYQLAHYREVGSVESPFLDLPVMARQLRAYAKACGPFAIHTTNPGTIGFLSGPEVTFIDLQGLTDATVARLPKELLVKEGRGSGIRRSECLSRIWPGVGIYR